MPYLFIFCQKLELLLIKYSLPKYKMFYFCLITTLFSFQLVFSQNKSENLIVNIIPRFNGEPLTKNTWYVTHSKDSIQISKLKFYTTNFIFTKKKSHVKTTKKQHLVDVFKKESLVITLSNTIYSDIDVLKFNIGVDETLNTSGANSGDLDPINGMFWSWQSGYINFKIEGKSPSCQTRKNKGPEAVRRVR